MSEVDSTRIQKFTRDLIKNYNENTLLDYFSLEDFDNERHNDLDFFKIPIKTNLPMKPFRKGSSYINTALAQQFAKSIYLGEQNFLLSKTKESENRINDYTLNEFNQVEILEALHELQNPTDMFLPIYFHNSFYEWARGEFLDFEYGKPVISIDGSEVRIHWLPDDTGFVNIFILNSNDIPVIQKRFMDVEMDEIEVIDDYQFNEPDDRIMLYYGSRSPDEFIFIVQTIISEPQLGEENACLIDTSNTDIELEENDF